MSALAHTHDPDTSHIAAAALNPDHVAAVKRAILALLEEGGPLTVTQLKAKYFAHRTARGWPLVDPHSIARRATDLKNDGLIVDTGQRRPTQFGRPSAVLGLTS